MSAQARCVWCGQHGAARTARRSSHSPQMTRDVARWHEAGMSMAQIADTLTLAGHTNPRGGQWWPSTVWRVIQTAAGDRAFCETNHPKEGE